MSTLRQFGTGPNINAIAQKAKEDLGINLELTALDTDATAQRVVTQPKSFDIADIEYFTLFHHSQREYAANGYLS